MKTASYIFAIVLLISQISYIKADLPVHCLKRQIDGKWEFELTEPVSSKNTDFVNCGHNSPDNEKTSWKAMLNDFKSSKTISLTLNDNDTTNGKIEDKQQEGSWTMIYDEGFEITHGSYKFFTFSKYQNTNMQFESVCDQTLVGWYHNTSTNEKGCLRGSQPNSDGNATANVKQDKVVQPKDDQKKEEKKDDSKKVDLKMDNQSEISQQQSLLGEDYKYEPEPSFSMSDDIFIFAQTKQAHKEKTHKSHLNHNKKNLRKTQEDLNLHKQFNDHEAVVKRLNTVQKSWTAAVPEEFKEYNIEEMNRRAGRIRHQAKLQQQQKTQFTISFAQKEDDGYTHFSREDVSDLPSEFSWEEYLRKPVQQKDCGSCYAIATSEMISARLKIKHDEDVKISAQHSIDCNFYNQGCDGGYGFLVSKFGSEYDLVPEECHPYKAVDGQCKNSCDMNTLKKTYKISDYGYVGGAYGKSSERKMMEEMMENGPVVVSFEPAYDFMYYSSGIYHSVDAEDWLKKHEKQPAWEKVDHSVLAYGWGEEKGQKYWKVLNSWGENWGEDGHFRIRKGTDESHIESMGEFANPYVVNHSH